METLPTKREDISPFVHGTDIEIVQASYGTCLSKLSPDLAIRQIVQLINKAFFELGKSPGGSTREERKRQLMIMAKLVLNDAKLYFQNLTLKELELAIQRGIRKMYGEFYGFNVIAVHQFIEGFIESEERKAALEKQRRYVESLKPPPQPTPEEIERIMAEGFEIVREVYFKTKNMIDYFGVNYDYAVEKGWINLTTNEKWELYHEAEKLVEKEMLVQETNIHHIITRKHELKANKGMIVIKAKKLALMQYFDNLKTTTNG